MVIFTTFVSLFYVAKEIDGQVSYSLLDYLFCGGRYNEFVEEGEERCISRHNFGEKLHAAIIAIQDVC